MQAGHVLQWDLTRRIAQVLAVDRLVMYNEDQHPNRTECFGLCHASECKDVGESSSHHLHRACDHIAPLADHGSGNDENANHAKVGA